MPTTAESEAPSTASRAHGTPGGGGAGLGVGGQETPSSATPADGARGGGGDILSAGSQAAPTLTTNPNGAPELRRTRSDPSPIGFGVCDPDLGRDDSSQRPTVPVSRVASAPPSLPAELIDSRTVLHSALVEVIGALRAGRIKKTVEAEVPDFRYAVPPEMLPTEAGKQLYVDEVLPQLCKSGGLPYTSGQLQGDGKYTFDPPPTAGGLVLVRMAAQQLAALFESESMRFECEFIADGVTVVPRAFVQHQPADKGTPHFVLFTERPHYPKPPPNPDGNRCALHCALMGIGVTEAWQQQSRYEGDARPRKRNPITRYDDHPTGKRTCMCNRTCAEFVADLKAFKGEEAYAYVLCDAPARSASTSAASNGDAMEAESMEDGEEEIDVSMDDAQLDGALVEGRTAHEEKEAEAAEHAATIAARTACPASQAADGGVTEAPLVSSGGSAAGGLEREVGTILDVHWSAVPATYRGSVERAEDGLVLVFYPCDRTRKWHDFGQDGCSCTVIEPAAHMLATLRRTAHGYDGQVVPGARWYSMRADYVIAHFTSCGESAWLASVGEAFVTVPQGAKRRSGKLEPVRKPFCVLGSLAKALRQAGNARGAERAEADCEASLLVDDRLKFAAERAPSYGCEARKVHANALEVEAEHPTLLQVSRTHVLAILGRLLFDSNEPEPLPLTRENLARCIGAPYGGAVVRGYAFVPHGPKAAVKRPGDEAAGDAKRPRLDGACRLCAACGQTLPTEKFTKSQRSKGPAARCVACVA